MFRQEPLAAPETLTEFALVLAIRFGFKLGAICHVLDLQVYLRHASSMSGSIAVLSVVTLVGEPEANAMAFFSWRPLSRRRLPCRPPLWLGAAPSDSPRVLLSPAPLYSFL